jgi:TetR/AcrR family transcriptional regulator
MPRYREDERKKIVAETRRKLMQAALDEFSLAGFSNANINRISESAGFAKGTIYNYFASKQELMLTLIAELSVLHLGLLTEAVRREQDPVRRLENFYAAGFEFVEAYPPQARFLINTLYGAAPEFKAALYQAYLPMFQLVAEEILAPGMAQGIFQISDPVRTAPLLMTIYLGTSSQVDAQGKVYLSCREVTEFVLRSLGKG